MQVLLIEDVADAARPLTMLLERAGCEVAWAANGREALDQVKTAAFDIIISDLWLTDIDGLSLMPMLQSHCPCAAIALSVDFFAGQLDRLKAAGFASFARKPVDVDTLLLLMRRLVGKSAPAYAGNHTLAPLAPFPMSGAVTVLA